MRVERALVFCVIFYRGWNALWYIVLYPSGCGMRSGILGCIFWHVECALVFMLYFSACGTRSGNMFIFFCVWNALWYFVLNYLHAERDLVFCIIFFFVWNALWYCNNMCESPRWIPTVSIIDVKRSLFLKANNYWLQLIQA